MAVLKTEIWNFFKIFFCAVVLCEFTNADLPADFPKCHTGDVECIPKAIMTLLKRYPKGNPEIGLIPVDEIVRHNVVISKAHSDGAIQLDLKFNEVKVYNLPDLNVTRVIGFEKDPTKSKFEVYGFVPNFVISGDYEANGRVLLLPLNGKGKAHLELKNLRFRLKTNNIETLNPVDGKHYLTLNKMKFKMEPEGFSIDMENLFYGNEELSKNLNNLINENWKDIWIELAPGINKAVSGIIKDIISQILAKLPYEDFYASD